MESKRINILPWLSRSPDLNPVENLWGMLARRVYSNGRQYSSINQLKSAILCCWETIKAEELVKLVNSMPNRMNEIIKNLGGTINY